MGHCGDASRKVCDVRRPVRRGSRGGMVRRQEGAGGGIRLGEPYEVEVGELETGKGDRGAGRIGGGEGESEAMKSGENGRGGGKIRDNDASVSGEPR